MSKSEVYKKIYEIKELVHTKDLTGKRDCGKLLKTLEKAIKFLEKKENK